MLRGAADSLLDLTIAPGFSRIGWGARKALGLLGHEVHIVSPQGWPSVPCPTYPDIRHSEKDESCDGHCHSDCDAICGCQITCGAESED